MIPWNHDIFWDDYHTVKISYRYNPTWHVTSFPTLFSFQYVYNSWRVWHGNVHGNVNVFGIGWIDLLHCCCGRASTDTCCCQYIHNILLWSHVTSASKMSDNEQIFKNLLFLINIQISFSIKRPSKWFIICCNRTKNDWATPVWSRDAPVSGPILSSRTRTR